MTQIYKAPVEQDVDNLLLDSKNPRIPEEQQSLSQEKLVVFVAETYNAIAVAKSIASHQYFSSEPLIAISQSGHTKLIVVEGNRRLAALKLLTSTSLRGQLADRSEWDAINTSKVPTSVPVVIARNRKEVAPIIGYRHISGIQPWDAYSKARYIAAQIEGGLSFEKTAKEVGETPAEVRANYRNYRIERQCSPSLEAETVNGLRNGFGVFTRAMQSPNLRTFIGAPAPNDVSVSKAPIPGSKKGALKEFMGFLFGAEAVLEDSRDLTRLGKVLGSPDGLKVLRTERNLEEAHVVSGGLRDRLVNRLSSAARNLRGAKDEISKYRSDKEVNELIGECRSAIDDLERAQKRN